MKDKIWNSVEEAVAQAIARIAIEVLETGVVLVTRKLKAMREEKEGASDDAPSTPTETSNLIHLFTPGKKLHFDELVNQSGRPAGPLAAELLQLEMQGYIRRLNGDLYAKAA